MVQQSMDFVGGSLTMAKHIFGWNEVDVEVLSMFAALFLKIAAGQNTTAKML